MSPVRSPCGGQPLGDCGLVRFRLREEASLQQDLRTQRAAKHLLELVNDVLDLSKIEAGKIDLRLQPVGFPGIVEELFVSLDRLRAHGLGLVVVDQLHAHGSLARYSDRQLLLEKGRFVENGVWDLGSDSLTRAGTT